MVEVVSSDVLPWAIGVLWEAWATLAGLLCVCAHCTSSYIVGCVSINARPVDCCSSCRLSVVAFSQCIGGLCADLLVFCCITEEGCICNHLSGGCHFQ